MKEGDSVKESEKKAAAAQFAAKWAGRGYEKGETQSFWLELLQQVYGVANPSGFIVFEEQVDLSHKSFIDATIQRGRLEYGNSAA